MATIIWSVTLWGLQWLWKWAVKGTASAEFTIALLYGSSALLEKPSLEPSVNISGQVMVADKALQEVRKGGFTLIDHKNYIKVVVATRYTDSRGQTQFYISNKGISILATFGWGLRISALSSTSPHRAKHRTQYKHTAPQKPGKSLSFANITPQSSISQTTAIRYIIRVVNHTDSEEAGRESHSHLALVAAK
ncbi:hypothetical protein O3P69_011025 [Scylla paramamosain]|uniref:Uncharacterized protein n=1 Tax=Scylla paramamosain TaxID=85552 RepID=A0AAW0SCK6_SCYPA